MANDFTDADREEREFLERQQAVFEPTRDRLKHCPDIEVLVANLSGDFPANPEITRHVADCTVCQMLLRDLVDPELPAFDRGREDRIFARVSAGVRSSAKAERSRWWSLWQPVPIAAFGLLALAIGSIWFYVWSSVEQPPAGSTVAVTNPAPAPPAPAPLIPLEKPAVNLPTAAALVFRNSSGNEEQLLADFGKAIDPFRNEQFAEAAERLAGFVKTYANSVEGWFYLGVSCLFVERHSDAIASLERAATLDKGLMSSDIMWYLAIAHQRNGQVADALVELQKLCNATGEFQSRACSALQTLQSK